MKYWEINGNLADSESGMSNFNTFLHVVCRVKAAYDAAFGLSIMNKVKLYVDNATEGSGYTPICTPVLEELVVIKLGIYPGDSEAKIAYQFVHELTHFVFYCLCGLNKAFADEEEEAICTAASLIMIKLLYPQYLSTYTKHVRGLSNNGYRKGANLATQLNYDINALKRIIEQKSSSYNVA